LNGVNRDERFHIWTGSGGNGKSKLLELFEMSFGDYSCKLPITLLTTKRKGSNEAQPELERTKGKRSAILQEPDEHTRLNVGLMKEMTGGDTIIARNLYEQPIEFKPQMKMILICNHLPELPYGDEATWRRVRCVEFKSKFVKDGDLSQNLKNWKEPFMWILLQYYKKWVVEGLYEPPDVTECTQKYKSQKDHFAEFFQNHLIKMDDESQCLGIRQIYKQYKEVAFHNSETPKKLKELQKYLEKRIAPITGNGNLRGWKGWTLKQLDVEDINTDDDSEFEVISSN
jgi:P4 family phage/plasmid primase-like protien